MTATTGTRRSRCLKICGLLLLCLAALFGTTLGLTPSPVEDARHWPVSPVLLDSNGDIFHVRLSSREELCIPVPLDNMGAWLPLVAVQVEDKRFFSHPGIDPLALARAAVQNMAEGRVVSGASTISSQVVRLTYSRPRTFRNKALEFLQAVRLDWSLSKREILEIYLNRAPFGGPVRGVEAAARSYFGKRAQDLSLAEAALLIGMLRGPSVYRPDKHPEATRERRDAILHRLEKTGAIDAKRLELALLEPIPAGRAAIPSRHRHFADHALRRLSPAYWEHGGRPIQTTLNPELQRILERALDGQLAELPERVTAAGGIVENETGALLAYVGNSRFGQGSGNWVDCAFSPRSPGSALKPFIYLRAMESGRLIPASLLADTPLSFAGMAPRNYDRLYRGPVTARYALANSLNAPAVRTLRKAGGESSLQFLRLLGFSLLTKNAAWYGDSLALGGCEVTLWQMLEAYTVLANLGLYRPVTPLAAEAGKDRGAPSGEKRLFSAAGGYLVAEILRDAGRMPPLLRLALQESGRHFAFKTGTSYGMRDAWAAAYTPAHTVAVWFGDAEGLPHPALIGLPLASPAALRVLRDIPLEHGQKKWYTPPEGLERFTACAFSGMPATPACPERVLEWRIAGVTRTTPCTIHVLREGETHILLPPELGRYSISRGAGKKTVAGNERAVIVSPLPGARFFLTPLAPEQMIELRAEGVRGTVYWFINQEFFGAQEGEDPLLWPVRPGKYDISLADERGVSAVSRFEVADVLERDISLIPLEP